VFARVVFAIVNFAVRKGLAENAAERPSGIPSQQDGKHKARRTGVRGETYAYWYLRRHGYVLVARNYMLPEMKGEIDLVGFDGPVLAFVEEDTNCNGP
jgi:Uncharacterised protein family UPF0102